MNIVFWSYLTWIVSGLSDEMYLAMLGTGRFLTVTARHSETRTPRIPDDVTTKCTFSDEGRNGQKSTWAVLSRTLKYSNSGFINGALEWTECVRGILIEKTRLLCLQNYSFNSMHLPWKLICLLGSRFWWLGLFSLRRCVCVRKQRRPDRNMGPPDVRSSFPIPVRNTHTSFEYTQYCTTYLIHAKHTHLHVQL